MISKYLNYSIIPMKPCLLSASSHAMHLQYGFMATVVLRVQGVATTCWHQTQNSKRCLQYHCCLGSFYRIAGNFSQGSIFVDDRSLQFRRSNFHGRRHSHPYVLYNRVYFEGLISRLGDHLRKLWKLDPSKISRYMVCDLEDHYIYRIPSKVRVLWEAWGDRLQNHIYIGSYSNQ